MNPSRSAVGALRNRCFGTWALPLALFLTLATGAHADPVLPTLAPGSTFRIVFVTSTTINATSANIATYNNHVASVTAGLDALLSSLSLTTSWRALASTVAVNALVNAGLSSTDTTTPFYNTAGQLIATGVFGPTGRLYGLGSHSNQILSESGNPLAGTFRAWTGTNSAGATANPLGSSVVRYGQPAQVNGLWTSTGVNPASTTGVGLYGVSGLLTVPAPPPPPAVPEPGTLALMGTAILALGISKIRRAGK